MPIIEGLPPALRGLYYWEIVLQALKTARFIFANFLGSVRLALFFD